MNLKEFFKPTDSKIILASVLVFIAFFVGSAAMFSSPCLDPTPECERFRENPLTTEFIPYMIFPVLAIIFAWPMFAMSMYLMPAIAPPNKFDPLLITNLSGIIGFLFTILWAYLFSCLIIWLYDKFKKQKRIKLKKKNILAFLIILTILILIPILVLQIIPADPCAKEVESEQASEGYSRPRDRCYWKQAIENKNVLFCKKISTNPSGIYSQRAKTLYNDLCYGYFCAIEKREDACNKIIDEDNRIEAIAIKSNVLSYCQNILDADRRHNCIGRVNGTYRYVVPD